MAIVYMHKGLDNEEIFYVGIGKTEYRSKSKDKRNKFWHNYINSHGFESIILFDNISWEEACKKEIELIKFYGRRDLGEGTLVNLTDGGQGGSTTKGRKNPSLTKMNKERKGKPGLKLKWINKDGKNTRVLEDKLQSYIDDGWNLGSMKSGPRPKSKGITPWNKGVSGYKNPKLSESLKGKTYKKQEKIKCPHCEVEGIISNMQRWHFDNCKNKRNE